VSSGVSPAAADRRSAHFLSLLTWGREDLDRVWERARRRLAPGAGPGPLAGARGALCGEAPEAGLLEVFRAGAELAGAQVVLAGPGGGDRSALPLLAERLASWQGAAAVAYRAASHARLLAATPGAPAPVVSGGTPGSHPFRVLADLFGLATLGADVDGLRAVWLGAPAAELRSWLEALVRYGFRLDLAVPDPAAVDEALCAYVGVRAAPRLGRAAAPEAVLPRADVVILGGDAHYVGCHRAAARPGAWVFGASGARPWAAAADAAVAGALLEDVAARAAGGWRS